MLLAVFVIGEHFFLEDFFEAFGSEDAAAAFEGGGRAAGESFEAVVGGASVAIGVGGDALKNFVGSFDVEGAEAAIGIGEGAFEERDDGGSFESVKDVDLHPREQGRNYFEGRIFGGRADEQDAA